MDLEDKILEEFHSDESEIEGIIHIGCGEFVAVETLAEILGQYKKQYPLVQITLHTGTADTILSKMNQGLIDLGLFMEPVNTEELRSEEHTSELQSRE